MQKGTADLEMEKYTVPPPLTELHKEKIGASVAYYMRVDIKTIKHRTDLLS